MAIQYQTFLGQVFCIANQHQSRHVAPRPSDSNACEMPFMADIVLVQPPVLKPAEPPLALAVLLAHLTAQGVPTMAIDANLDAYLYLLDGERLTTRAGTQVDTSLQRALKHRDESLTLVRSPAAGQNFARYATAVRYLNRLLAVWDAAEGGERLTLGDYQCPEVSPFAPEDLARVAGGEIRTLFAEYFRSDLVPRIVAASPKVVAISINFIHQAIPAFELAGLLRRLLPDVVLVAGGGLITSWQDPIRQLDLRLPPFDHVVFGPGETALTALAKGEGLAAYAHKNASSIDFVPDFSFARLGEYLSPQTILPLTASRGCYWRKCLFCPEATAPIHPYRTFPPAQLPDLMRSVADQHGISHIQLTDNAVPVKMLKVLAERSADLAGLNWFGFVRFEAVLEDADFVRRLAQGGCRMLQVGLESGSQQVLDRLGKGVRLESASRILKNLAAAGIASYVYILLGTPGETEADAEMTLAFLEAHASEIGFLNISIMNLPRASGLLEKPEQYGIAASEPIAADNPLGLYQKFQPKNDWDRAAARRFLERRLLGSAVIRAIVNRNPPLFTSNHAIFFAESVLKASPAL